MICRCSSQLGQRDSWVKETVGSKRQLGQRDTHRRGRCSARALRAATTSSCLQPPGWTTCVRARARLHLRPLRLCDCAGRALPTCIKDGNSGIRSFPVLQLLASARSAAHSAGLACPHSHIMYLADPRAVGTWHGKPAAAAPPPPPACSSSTASSTASKHAAAAPPAPPPLPASTQDHHHHHHHHQHQHHQQQRQQQQLQLQQWQHDGTTRPPYVPTGRIKGAAHLRVHNLGVGAGRLVARVVLQQVHPPCPTHQRAPPDCVRQEAAGVREGGHTARVAPHQLA